MVVLCQRSGLRQTMSETLCLTLAGAKSAKQSFRWLGLRSMSRKLTGACVKFASDVPAEVVGRLTSRLR